MSSSPVSPPLDQRIQAAARRLLEVRKAGEHPAFLLDHVRCVDNTTGETFQFQLLDPEAAWYWQREVLDEWIRGVKSIALKARQIGITWLAGGYALWHLLYQPGTKVLAVSINESEAAKVVNRVWDMYHSLPEHLRGGVRVQKPSKGARPSTTIEFVHPDGRVSSMIGLPSTPKAGHGETAALVILDEFSRQDYAAETWKAVLPTTQGGGRVLVISTGNGRGSNHFYQLWANADEYGLTKRFLPWSNHPDRDDAWYSEHAMALPSADRGEQYPRDPTEAFILTGRPYFDIEALTHYNDLVPEPKYRFDFQEVTPGRARKQRSDHGLVRVYTDPVREHSYAIGADVATGRGADYSCAYVVDLSDMDLVAEFHGKLDADLFAEQLHYLGRFYNTALVAVEVGGGYGEAVNIPLRDGRSGRSPYPKLYKHILSSRPDLPIAKPFGFPMNSKTRPLVISQLEKAIREKALPFLTERLLLECGTFIHADTLPTPRAQDGCHDDAVMAAAITLEMYRLRGKHAPLERRRKRLRLRRRTHETQYPWEQPDADARDELMDERYPGDAAA